MKVLHVIDSLGVGGGAEHSLAAMLPLLRERGIDSTIATIRPRGFGLEVSLAEQGFPVEVLQPEHWPGRVNALRRKVRRERPDVVHASLFNSCMLSRLALMGTRVPQVNSLVLTAYDPSRTEGIDAAAWKLRVVRTADAVTARHLVDRVHAVTGAVRDEAVDVLGVDPARISVIPRGRSAAKLGEPGNDRRAATRRSLELADATTVVLNVGRQDHQKAQAGLIRAFAELHRRRPDSVLLIAGRRGDASDEVDAALADVDLGDAVRMLGHRDDVADLYCAADLFVFPSLYEGMAGSILEAMALGTPVVGSDAVAIAEVLEHGRLGPIATRGDDRGLADAMDGLLSDPDRMAELSELGRAEFGQRYEIHAVADAMADMYRSVAHVSPADRPTAGAGTGGTTTTGEHQMGTARNGVKARLRASATEVVKWTYRSGHRDGLTAGLQPVVEAMRGTVLDIGGGRDSPLAGFWQPSVTRLRLDISSEFLPHVQGDAAALPIRSESVDAVMLSEVLEHVPETRPAIEEVHRILRPGGVIAGSVPFLAQGLHADPHDYYRFTDQALRRFLSSFEEVVVRPHGNGLGIAWRMIVGRYRVLRPLNPLMRRLSRRPDPRVPEGYTFHARKPAEPQQHTT